MRFLLLAALSVSAADPHIGYVYPAGIQAGTTNRFVVGGQYFWRDVSAHVTGEGVRVLDMTLVPFFPPPAGRQRQHLEKWLYALAKGEREEPALPEDPYLTEWRECTWWRHLDQRDALELSLVARDLFTTKNSLQTSPSLRQMAIVTLAADGDAPPGRRELMLLSPSGASAPQPFFVTQEPHVSETRFLPPRLRQPGPAVTAVGKVRPLVIDGQILPGETDRFSFSCPAPMRIRCRLSAREMLPYIGDAVPGFFNPVLRLVAPGGEEIAFADDDRFRPDPVLYATLPAAGEYVLEVRDNLYRGREDFVYMIDLEEVPSWLTDAMQERPKPVSWMPAGNVSPGVEGCVDAPGKTVFHPLDIPAPGTRFLGVRARQDGSPLDPVLTLYAPRGLLERWRGPRVLETWDDVEHPFYVGDVAQAECDSAGMYDFPAAGRYYVGISDRTGAGGPDYTYTFDAHVPKGDFTVYATRSTLPVRRDVVTRMTFRIARHEGFAGDVKILDTPRVIFRPNILPAASNAVSVRAIGRWREADFAETEIWAEGRLQDGSVVRRRVVPAHEVQQAFAWSHLLPARTFFASCVHWKAPPPRPSEWLDIPLRRYADMRVGKQNFAEVTVDTPRDERRLVVAHRRWRGRPLVRARQGAHLPARVQIHELFADGVTEIVDAAENPVSDVYVRRLMGQAQNARPYNDVLVYAPTASLATVQQTLETLRREGWCADLLPENRLSSLTAVSLYRAVFVPAGVDLSPEEVSNVVSRVRRHSRAVVFEDRCPEILARTLKKERSCRVSRLPDKRAHIVAGPRTEALALTQARREPFRRAGLLCARFKDDTETVYFLANPTSKRIAETFRPALGTLYATLLEPQNGRITALTPEKGTVRLDLGPGEALWLRTYPYAWPQKEPEKRRAR